jgi:membrane-bound lytic murein transglycosylase B
MAASILRRDLIRAIPGTLAAVLCAQPVPAQSPQMPYSQWLEHLRARARERGVSDATFTRVMGGIKPDTAVYELERAQPEFHEELWQYLNRRVSEWRILTGKERAKQYASLLSRVERDYAVAPSIMLGIWGMESAFGDVVVNPKHMRPVIPALAALAWGEPRRRSYWEQELLNALVIVERGWSSPQEMIGSWAGAMGHTQWMPEVWLHMGVDYNHDGRISPYGPPDDAIAGTARFVLQRGRYRRGDTWGYEVRLPPGLAPGQAERMATRSIAGWQQSGVGRADGRPFLRPTEEAQIVVPVPGGPVFLITQNFHAVKSYDPSFNYALAVCHLGDRILGANEFTQPFPGGERTPTLAEVQEIQRRLTALGFDTDGTDGRVGRDTMVAVRAFQRKTGLEPADGYAGLKVLARLRRGA